MAPQRVAPIARLRSSALSVLSCASGGSSAMAADAAASRASSASVREAGRPPPGKKKANLAAARP